MARGSQATNKMRTGKTRAKYKPGRVYGGGVKINTKSSGLSAKQKAVNKAQSTVHENTRLKQRIHKGVQGIKNRAAGSLNKRPTRRK